MAMDFFEHQARARSRTSTLLVLYLLAIVSIDLAIYFVVSRVLGMQMGASICGRAYDRVSCLNSLHPKIFVITTLCVLGVIGLGTLFRMMQLSQGGSAVAESLGARKLDTSFSNPLERRVQNVVEEMAIASGVAVPEIYVLPEGSINAFAAGLNIKNAVVTVTEGTMKRLTREELQGVVAHEFSHILNGDMRLNLRLLGLLYGILMLSLIGRGMYRLSEGRSSKKGDATAAFVIIGLALALIGSIGVFFARLIKSAVSRQREFLADASAVQFTRSSQGIAGALQKIGGFSMGSRVRHSGAEEVSHMFFANGLSASYAGLWATHPPLKQRIKRILPDFNGVFPSDVPEIEPGLGDEAFGFASGSADAAIQSEAPSPHTAAAVIASVGKPQPVHVVHAQKMLTEIVPALRTLLDDPQGAKALVIAMFMLNGEPGREKQLAALAADSNLAATVPAAEKLLQSYTSDSRLSIIDLSFPALRRLGQDEYNRFKDLIQTLINADNCFSLYEYALSTTISRTLEPYIFKTRPRPVRYVKKSEVEAQARVLFSSIAYGGHENADDAASAYAKSAEVFGLSAAMREYILDRGGCGVTDIDWALRDLVIASPEIKRDIVSACVESVAHDGVVNENEAGLLRAVCSSLDCPLPPII